MLTTFIKQHKLPEKFRLTAKDYFQPLAERIFSQFSKSSRPYFVGINGCQGSGKSTLTDYIGEYLTKTHKLNIVVMSLDDFYFTGEKRQELSRDIHPLLATRGVPGTHDMAMLENTLIKLKAKETGFTIPRFNKATDEPYPQEQWQVIEKPIDIILLEGWCWGVKPQTAEQLISPVNELELKHDKNGAWRNYVNQQLQQYYQPLYAQMDFWLALQAPSFDCVYKWRLEQEEKLKANNQGLSNSKIMQSDGILNFTQYFQRLSVQACNTISQSADAIFYLDYARNITSVPVTDDE
ncbi:MULTISPECIES: kinase [unclassified Colwellia]|jgi:D-glycerate 3-kinase|uniref:kinase n=1 Tax=unclassified Colwellia TaxID=196834 RepID=UPI000D343E7F|nr:MULTISPECIES: kinase [unclassified Colwellia]AWB56396.1 kinase [Colwellia sp. Arc7-D]MBA6415751.1 kinase [Colwellia sp. 6M3]|tara:strand:+ start:185 stop:1066 length:882 start_codon:yes stop_codon:yes gene_type:complete